MMVRTRASEAASTSAACQWPRRAPIQEVQDLESDPYVVIEEVESDDTTRDMPVPGELIRRASTAIDEEDAE